MPLRTLLIILALVIAASGLTVAALVWLPLPASWAIVGLLAAALLARLSRRD